MKEKEIIINGTEIKANVPDSWLTHYGKQDSGKTNSLGMGKISVGAELAHNSKKMEVENEKRYNITRMLDMEQNCN